VRENDEMADSVGERIASLEATFREFKDAITKSISGIDTLLWRAIIGGLGATISLWIGFAALYKEIAGLDNRMVGIEGQLKTLNGTTKTVSEAVTNIPNAISELKNTNNIVRGNTEAPGTLNILVFGPSQLVLIRDMLPKFAAVQPFVDKLAINDVVTDPKIWELFAPVPPPMPNDIPQLSGTRFAVGQANIAIARVADSRVVAIVVR
jgi:hypothetical protein